MKPLLYALLVALLCGACSLQHPLVGRWKTSDKEGTESVLYFKDDGSFQALTGGENLPGTWSIDEEVDPQRLTLVFEQKTVVTIMKLNADHLLIEPSVADQELPSTFSKNAQDYSRQ